VSQDPTWSQSALPLNVNQHSKELRWLVKVGVFSQSKWLLKNPLAVHENPRGAMALCLPLPTPVLGP